MPKKRGHKKHSPHRDGGPYAWAIWRNGEIVARIIDATQREALGVAAELDKDERTRKIARYSSEGAAETTP